MRMDALVFREVALTRAALLLAQGAGRLIRSESDRGVVAVLDSRMATAGYGGAFACVLATVVVHHRRVGRPSGPGPAQR